MLEFYSTPLDVLYFSLTIVVSVLGLFLIIALYHLIKILANVNSVTTKAKDTMDLVNHYLWQPIKFAMMIVEKSKAAAAANRKRKAHKSETDNAV